MLYLILAAIIAQGALSISVADVAPEGFEFVVPEDASKSAALNALGDARAVIEEMEAINLSITFVNDALAEADTAFEQEDYVSVFRLSQLVQYIRDDNIYFMDTMRLMEQKERAMRDKGVDTTSVYSLIEQSMDTFNNEQFDEAHAMMTKADSAMKQADADHRRATLIRRLGKNFFLRYWWQIILIIVILSVVSYPIAKSIQKNRLKSRIARLHAELKNAQGLIKVMQHKCFVEKKMTTKTYKTKVERYEDKIAEIKHTLPVLEAQLKGEKVKQKKSEMRGVLKIK